MNNQTKINRINQTIKETERQLVDAIVKHENSLKYLEMEIAENKEFGNDDSANDHAREYVKERADRVEYLQNHIKYLENMKQGLIK